jgi:hypothetical protein
VAAGRSLKTLESLKSNMQKVGVMEYEFRTHHSTTPSSQGVLTPP